jgi:SAM-dependent methyltransferase
VDGSAEGTWRRVCPVCGAEPADPLFRVGDRWYDLPGSFAYVRCRACDTSYLRNPPADLAAYYPIGYIRTGRLPARLRSAMRRRDLGHRVRLAASVPRSGVTRRLPAVLDIGCARGDFLVEMRRAGWIVAGVEPTQWLAREALARGLPVWPTSLEAAGLPRARFDVVTMWDVLEHVPDVVATLDLARSLLAPGGRLIVNTPLADGWDARVFGASWSGWDAPRHMTVFTRRTLGAALQRAGFEPESWNRVFETYLITALTISLAARRRLPARAAHATWSALHARPVRLVMQPVFAVADAAAGASSLAVVAKPCA